MQKPIETPALALRGELLALQPFGMLRWDQSGRALLVSDAPRHAQGTDFLKRLHAMNLRLFTENGLVWIDLPPAAYQSLLSQHFYAPGPWVDAWFAEQALLASILAHVPDVSPCGELPPSDEALLRGAMLACTQAEPVMRQYLAALRAEHAVRLRTGNRAASHASAVLCAHWLWTEHLAGLPPIVFTSIQNRN